MEEKQTPVFIDGYITRDILNTEPEWILGKGAMHADKMIAWLQENKKHADKGGWIPYQTLRSKEKGTRYSVIDMYQVNKSIEGAKTTGEYNDTKYRNIDGTVSGTSEVSQKHPNEGIQKINDEASDRLFKTSLTEDENKRLAELPF